MNAEEQEAARVVARFGRRAHEIANELHEAWQVRDGKWGGLLCQEMYENPDLLMLVVTLLLSTPSSGPLATPEEMGADMSSRENFEPAAWQVAANDQAEAAMEADDFPAYAEITTNTWLKGIVMDIRNYKAERGEWPDASFVLRGTMIADHGAVAAVAAECLYRAAMAEIGGWHG